MAVTNRKSVKDIFDLISAEPGTNKKMEILERYKENPVLKRVLYMANSGRVKFYIKQLPKYVPKDGDRDELDLPRALDQLEPLSKRSVTGQAALDYLSGVLSSLTKQDACVIERIIDKDCKIGMGTTNMNKVIPKLIEDTPYMGAKAYDKKLIAELFAGGKKCFSEVKMDGRYCNAVICDGNVYLESRQGEANPLDGAAFVEDLKRLPNCVLNGELTMDGFTRYESNGIIASLVDIGKKIEAAPSNLLGLLPKNVEDELKDFQRKNNMTYENALGLIRFTVWDTISLDEYAAGSSDVPRHARLSSVVSLVSECSRVFPIESRVANSISEAMEHFQELLAKGEEGTIVKSWDGKWKDGKPKWQVKLKLEMDVDLEITGFNYGTGKNAHVISSLNAKTSDGLLNTSPTGLKEEMMEYVTKNMDRLLGTIVEVKCNGLSKDGSGNHSLLYPQFKKLRDDKKVADTLHQVQKIEAAAKGLS